ncbi:CAAX protease [Candidatus Paracaedimonas acanthamoebae]|nr:CAAX protease [Candidatus Paracaedimonas acanthamoebae]
MDNIKHYKHPIIFYFLSISITWLFWFIAAYLSHINSPNNHYSYMSGILEIIGLISPMAIAFTMMYLDPHLRHDLLSRIFSVSNVKFSYILIACFLMPISIVLAQGISIFFGYSIDQFKLSSVTSFSFSLFSAWFMLFLAPILEELAWHSYGTDCLRARFNLFTTSIIFGMFWVLWHLPLSFIKGYYHSNTLKTGWLYLLNFSLSLFPFVLLMNWLYYKANRNILIAVVFHITAGFFNEIFSTHPDSKIMQTAILIILSFFIIYKEQDLFFKREF